MLNPSTCDRLQLCQAAITNRGKSSLLIDTEGGAQLMLRMDAGGGSGARRFERLLPAGMRVLPPSAGFIDKIATGRTNGDAGFHYLRLVDYQQLAAFIVLGPLEDHLRAHPNVYAPAS